ncbi:hypothetical protein SDC9_129927 [bioreactor metagenome]|uniref:Uncharacterized protein n=1 Tax=bioreactor metagenome TaxID=1076179 RepID=A0A645D169_9ZZZZ
MARFGVHPNFEGKIAFFSHANCCGVALEAGDYAVVDAAALIHHSSQMDATFLQFSHNSLGTFAKNLFITAKAEHHGTFRLIPGGDELFCSFQQRNKLAFNIQCTAAPDVAFGDLAREGRVFPLVQRNCFEGHHVLMGSQQHRVKAGIFAWPGKQQTGIADDLAFHGLVHMRIGLFQHFVQFGPVFHHVICGIFVGDGFDLNERSEMFGALIFVQFQLRDVDRGKVNGIGCFCALDEQVGAYQHKGCQKEQYSKNNYNDG